MKKQDLKIYTNYTLEGNAGKIFVFMLDGDKNWYQLVNVKENKNSRGTNERFKPVTKENNLNILNKTQKFRNTTKDDLELFFKS